MRAQLIQALLQSANPGAAPHALLGLQDADAQERARMHQLQALLAALQVRGGRLLALAHHAPWMHPPDDHPLGDH